MSRTTKRIDGVMSATVGFDWITLNFGSHTITIDNLKIYNGQKENVLAELSAKTGELETAQAELTKEREANKRIVPDMSIMSHNDHFKLKNLVLQFGASALIML